MGRFPEAPPDFCCPYRYGCPHLGGLSAEWARERYHSVQGTEAQYEHTIERLCQELDEQKRLSAGQERKIAQVTAELRALQRRQFKGRKVPAPAPDPEALAGKSKKRGAPKGHPPWTRRVPRQMDLFVDVKAPEKCPHCQCADLRASPELREHVQEDIVLEPRVITTCFVHELAHCPHCQREVQGCGPGELPGSYIGPAAKAAAIYLRYELSVPDRKISRFFEDFFGLRFVPASAYGFERQAARRGEPLYRDLLQKVQSLKVAHADETSWRHDGQPYWVWYAGNKDLAAFLWDAHRTSESAQKILGENFAGTLVADGLASYNGVNPKARQSCLAHIKTKAKELEQEVALLKGGHADPAALKFCRDIQGWVHETCQAHAVLAKGRWQAHAAKSAERTVLKSLREHCKSPLRYHRAEKFRRRLLGPEQDLLLTCFRQPNVPPTNNQAERSLRPVVIMRKVIQGTRSEKGLENHTILRSLFETARRQAKSRKTFFWISLLKAPSKRRQRFTETRSRAEIAGTFYAVETKLRGTS